MGYRLLSPELFISNRSQSFSCPLSYANVLALVSIIASPASNLNCHHRFELRSVDGTSRRPVINVNFIHVKRETADSVIPYRTSRDSIPSSANLIGITDCKKEKKRERKEE